MPFSRKCGAAIAVTFCVAMAAILSSSSAHATTYFSGHVSDSHGNAIAGASIEAGSALIPLGFFVAGQATTDAQGNYAITSLATNGASSFVLLARASGHVTTIYPNV